MGHLVWLRPQELAEFRVSVNWGYSEPRLQGRGPGWKLAVPGSLCGLGPRTRLVELWVPGLVVAAVVGSTTAGQGDGSARKNCCRTHMGEKPIDKSPWPEPNSVLHTNTKYFVVWL